jgi:peptidoglycan/LPS O-acetylase OafA/YrhL
MIPRFPALPNNGSTLDGPIWTLLYELIANMVYALTIRILNIWVIGVIMLVSAAGLVAGELAFHTLDIGYNLTDQWAALARVGFSFFAGVLVYRLSNPREHRSTWASFACVAVLGAALAVHLPHRFTMVYELASVIIGGPLLLFVAARLEPEPISGRVFTFIGLISYGVYLIHQPLGNLVTRELSEVMDIPQDLSGLWFGAAFLAFVVALAWALDRLYDAPIRKVLRAWAFPPRPAGG